MRAALVQEPVDLRLEPYEIATLAARLDAPAGERGGTGDLAPRGEPAQPVYSDYWLHNKGAAPMGYQAVTVQVKPSFLTGEGPFTVFAPTNEAFAKLDRGCA